MNVQQLSSSLRDCIVFLTQDILDEETQQIKRLACATGFIVGVPAKSIEFRMGYIVTARHCVESSNKNTPLFVRFSSRQNRVVDAPTQLEQWTMHSQTDVCIAPLKIDISDDPNISFVPIELLLSTGEAERSSIKEGHELSYISLFTQHIGRNRILPVMRSGRIALMPHEKVTVKVGPKNYQDIDAYLIEALSLGGHSGSPVFTIYPECIKEQNLKASQLRLLGLLSSHFEIDRDVEMLGDFVGSASVRENSGIAVVIPAQAIIDLLMDEDEILKRETSAKLFADKLASHTK